MNKSVVGTNETTLSAAELFIGGHWSASETGETLPVFAPSTGAAFASIARGTAHDVERAVRAARTAFEGAWGRMPAVERGRLLQKLAQRISDNASELIQLEALDTGKPIKQATADITVVSRYFEFYGAAADKIHGQTIPFLEDYFVAVVNEPFGVTGHILPWNYPAQMFGRTLGPALAAGNAVVLKPAEEACLSTLRLASLAAEVGFPEGVINVVTGLGEEAGAALAAHPRINFLSFTGSPEVGTLVQKAAAENHVGCVLELGGKSPQIVFSDADFDRALPVITQAIVQNAGQTCSAGSRVLVESSVYDAFLERLANSFSHLVVGAHDMDVDCGPLISAAQRDRVDRYVHAAEKEGIPVVAQGRLAPHTPSAGYYSLPKLFSRVPPTNALAREEVFGPVLAALAFRDEEDAVRLANGTEYGLIASVWTRDGARQLRVARRLECGQVYVNCYGAGGGVELPFGGVKKSGHGREKGLAAVHEFCRTKTLVINAR